VTKPPGIAISIAMPLRSPCINVCRIDRRSGLCEGCKRNVDEITRWPLASEAEQAAILAELPSRELPRKRLGVRW
jgi:predicted Fe-S protein YdhL (DUF1289 family)